MMHLYLNAFYFYSSFTCTYLSLMLYHSSELIPLHFYFLTLFLFTTIDSLSHYAALKSFNSTGISPRGFTVFNGVLSAVRNTF